MQTQIANKWILGFKIGGGSFGEIYKVYNSETNEEEALKMQKRTKNKQMYFAKHPKKGGR